MRNLLLLAVSALAACATTAVAPPPPGGLCHGENLGQFAGRQASPELGAEVLRVSGARVLRWVAHGSVVTMDYSDQRVTVWLTADNRVDRAVCG
jgi:hypothetical protein